MSMFVSATADRDRVRTVSLPSETLGEHGDLRAHADAYRCCVIESFSGTALVGFGGRQHARAQSISKRAPSIKAAVQETGACRRGGRAPNPRALHVRDGRFREQLTPAHASNATWANQLRTWCRQKEPPHSDRAWGPLIWRRSASILRVGGDNFSDSSVGDGGRVSRDLVYT